MAATDDYDVYGRPGGGSQLLLWCLLAAPALTCCRCDLRRSPVLGEGPPQIALEARGPRVCGLWQRR
jgi:hypothetical protein